MKKAGEILGLLIVGIFLFAVIWICVLINTWQKDICINNGGMVVDTGLGYFEKCIYGSEKE